MTEDIEFGIRMSSTTRPAKNLPASMNMAENAEVGEGCGGDDEMVKKPPSKKLSGLMRYLTSLRSRKKMSFLW